MAEHAAAPSAPHATGGTDTRGLGSGAAHVVDVPFELARLDALEGLMDDLFAQVDLADAEGLSLVNNAGLLDPVAAVEHLAPEATTLHVMVDLVAPMRLTSLVLRHTGGRRAAASSRTSPRAPQRTPTAVGGVLRGEGGARPVCPRRRVRAAPPRR